MSWIYSLGLDPSSLYKDEARWRSVLLLVLSIGYGGSMLAFRPTVMMSLPTILAELRLSQEDGGVLLTTCQFAYMVSKPLAQVASDSLPGPPLLSFSLVATAICCCLIPTAAGFWQLQALLFCLMVCQAPHAPACMRIISNWYKAEERGKAFSAINGAVNMVSCMVPILVNSVLLATSWHMLYVGIGVATLAIALLQLPVLSDRPPSETMAAKAKDGTKQAPEGRAFDVLLNRPLLGVGLLFAMLYGVRFGIEGWMGTFLRETATHPGTPEAASGTTAAFLFWWQVGGFLGSSVLGPLSDYFGGRTLPLAVSCAALLGGAAGIIHTIEHSMLQVTWRLQLAAALSGACVYGIRLLFNLFTRTQVPASMGGKADALVSSLAEMGGMLAGFPLIRLVNHSETWSAYTASLLALSGLLCAGTAALAAQCPMPEKAAKGSASLNAMESKKEQ